LIAIAPNTWQEMHQSLFIFSPKIVNICGDDNKGKIVGVGKIGTNPSTSTKKMLYLLMILRIVY